MAREVTMKFQVVENGLIVRRREGNKWGEKRWVVGFRDPTTDPFAGLLGGESVSVGHLVRDALFGLPKQLSPQGQQRGEKG